MKPAESSYKTNQFFLKDRETYKALADKVTKLHQQVDKTADLTERIVLLKELVSSLGQFDKHLQGMVDQYPEYYRDLKPYLDGLLEQNKIFQKASEAKIVLLNRTIN